jgi:DNA adenine methylase
LISRKNGPTVTEKNEPRVADSFRLKKPFLKWAGSKTKLVKALKPLLPLGEFRFIEPFVGAGAVFLNTDYPANLLCDSNAELICLYQALQQHGSKFVQRCASLFTPENNREDRFYEFRTEFNEAGDPERRAALFVYLNRHCYNGLCRYNQDGQFNTPFGRYERPYFPGDEMLDFAVRLKSAALKVQDFRVSMSEAASGDVVYCDPPYVPLSATANFTGYASGGFSLEDQKDLAACSIEAARRGATVVVSNHDTALTRRLYEEASQIVAVLASRTISCDGENRGKAKEIIALFNAASPASPKPAQTIGESSNGLASPKSELRCNQMISLANEAGSNDITSSNVLRDGMKTLNNTTRHWLLENHYEDVAALIDEVALKWEKEGAATRRNWWDVLAGDREGKAAIVKGVKFPVLRAARIRKGLKVTAGCLCRNKNEEIPPVRKTGRWLMT